MPVVAAQRPVQHHQPSWQTAVGECSLQTDSVQGFVKGRGWCRPFTEVRDRAPELSHDHPGGGLHGLPNKKRVLCQRISRWSTGFIPGFSGLPAPAERRSSQCDQVTQITAIDPDPTVHPLAFPVAVQLQSLNAITSTINRLQTTTRPPVEQRLGFDPALQQTLGLLGTKSEAADPVLIKSFGNGCRQGSDELTPEPRLPAAQFMPIGSADSCGTEHAPKPRPWG